MKNKKLNALIAWLFVCGAVIPAFALEKAGNEKELETSAKELNKKYSEGQQRVTGKIMAQFSVDQGRIVSLRYRKLHYGEIAIALGLAQDMHGGITDENLHKVVALREGPPVAGWGKVAGKLGLKLGPVLGKINSIVAEVRKDEKGHKVKKARKEKAAAAEKSQKAAKLERPEQIEKEGMKSLARP